LAASEREEKRTREKDSKVKNPLCSCKTRRQVNVIHTSTWYTVGWRIRDDPRAGERGELVPAPGR